MPVTGLLDSVKENISQVTGLTDFIDDVDLRLQSLNYTIQEGDAWLIAFCIQKVVNTIKNNCNIKEIPDGLRQIAVNMVCGEFLFNKKNSGDLSGFEIDISNAAIKRIQEGDTTIEFAFGSGDLTPEQRLNAVINYLMTCGNAEFSRYRRLRW
jgi:hypothetical protein